MFRRSVLLLAVLLPACAKPPAPIDREAVRSQIQARNDAWLAAFSAGDSLALGDFYTADVVNVQVGKADLVGREAFVADLAAGIRTRTDTLIAGGVRTESVEGSDSLAYETGTGWFRLRPKGDANGKIREVRTKYITFWAKGPDGIWRVRRDLTVRDADPTTTAVPASP